MLNKTIIALTAAIVLGCVPMATDALAAGQPKGHAGGGHTVGGHAMGGHAMAGYARGAHGARYGRHYEGGAPIYDSCSDGSYGTGYGCRGYGVPFVGGVINGIFGGYAPY